MTAPPRADRICSTAPPTGWCGCWSIFAGPCSPHRPDSHPDPPAGSGRPNRARLGKAPGTAGRSGEIPTSRRALITPGHIRAKVGVGSGAAVTPPNGRLGPDFQRRTDNPVMTPPASPASGRTTSQRTADPKPDSLTSATVVLSAVARAVSGRRGGLRRRFGRAPEARVHGPSWLPLPTSSLVCAAPIRLWMLSLQRGDRYPLVVARRAPRSQMRLWSVYGVRGPNLGLWAKPASSRRRTAR